MLYWLSGLPIAVSLILTIALFCGYGIGGFFLVRRWLNPGGDAAPRDGAPFTFMAGAITSVLLGFAVVTLGNQFRIDRAEVAREAHLVVTLHEYVASYPPDVRRRLDDALANYVETIVHREFPALREGRHVEPDDTALVGLRRALLDSTLPKLSPEFRSSMMQRFLEATDLRSQRLAESGALFPRTIWIPILATTLLALTATFFVVIPDLRVQLALIALVAAAYGVLLYVVIQLDYPFTGPTAIGAQPFVHALATIRGSGG